MAKKVAAVGAGAAAAAIAAGAPVDNTAKNASTPKAAVKDETTKFNNKLANQLAISQNDERIRKAQIALYHQILAENLKKRELKVSRRLESEANEAKNRLAREARTHGSSGNSSALVPGNSSVESEFVNK